MRLLLSGRATGLALVAAATALGVTVAAQQAPRPAAPAARHATPDLTALSAAKHNYRMSAFITGITTSAPFRMGKLLSLIHI